MILYFYGNGKGKTTAGIGNLIRAKNYNKKILLIQFLKLNTIEKKLDFDVFCFGTSSFIYDNKPNKEHYSIIKKGFKFLFDNYKKYDVIMLDELSMVLYFKLYDKNKIFDFIKKFSNKEYPVLIITGRYFVEEIKEIADLVSEIKEIKHPYQKGKQALEGIDF